MLNQTEGSWDALEAWPLIGLHATVMDDGRVLTFGTDDRGMQGGQFIYDIYDPATGEHLTLPNTTPTDIFCSAAVIIPGTNEILIAGGDARPLGSTNTGVNDVNIINMDTGEIYLAPNGDMEFQRWYPTMVSLPTGQMVMIGGTDINGRGVSTPEIYTHGEGWKSLTGAVDTDLGASALYSRAFVDNNGDVIYFATGRGNNNQFDVKKLDVDGNGSVTSLGTLPFNYDWDSPSVMYDAGKILIQDSGTGLWSMDINGPTPTYEMVGTLSQQRNWSNMTTLADGTVLINGGTSNGNYEAGADMTAVIWNPENNQLTYGADEDNPRLYHSASVLLNDGTLLSLGGGSAGISENNYLDGQVYRPPYLYDDNGNLATRPIITDAPDALDNGESFTITVDDAASIQKITFVKSGSATHATNMDTRLVELDFTVGPNNTLNITMPESSEGVVAGSWMLFAWNNEGVPSIAPMVSVNPEFNTGAVVDHENLLDNGSFETASEINGWEVNDYIFGWESSNNEFELWEDGYQGIAASDGETFIEVDGQFGTISQSVETQAGQTYALSFEYTGGPGNVASSRMEVLWNGQVIETIVPTNSIQQTYEFMVTGTGGEDTLAFRSIETIGDYHGGLLDNVSLKATTDTSNTNDMNDVPNVTQYLTGVSNEDSFIINGNSSDYGWGPTQDGLGIVVWGPTGHDLLYEFETIQFNNETISLNQSQNDMEDIPNVTQYLTGTTAEETFVINGTSSDYGWGPTQDGLGIVVWGPTGFDLLYNIENIQFNDTIVALDSSGTDNIVQDIASQTQYLTGTSGVDQFEIDGNSSDFGWGATQDGQGVVVWNNVTGAHDLLYDFEEIVFNDQTTTLDDQTV